MFAAYSVRVRLAENICLQLKEFGFYVSAYAARALDPWGLNATDHEAGED